MYYLGGIVMKISLAEPKYLKESISIISDLVNEARFKISSEGLELVAMDPANVAMVIFKLLSSAFSEYYVKGNFSLAINLSNFKQILRRIKPNDVLTLEMTPENKLKVTLKSNATRTFSLPIIEMEEKDQKIPDLKFPLSVNTRSSVLNDAIEDVDIVGESVSFMAEPSKMTVSAEGDLSQAKIEIPQGDDTRIKMTGEDKIKAKYSIEYLKKMISGSKLSDNVVINFAKDYPLKIEYKVVDRVMLSFILAPRVDND